MSTKPKLDQDQEIIRYYYAIILCDRLGASFFRAAFYPRAGDASVWVLDCVVVASFDFGVDSEACVREGGGGGLAEW